MSNDVDADIERLYNAIRDGKMNTAKMSHTHLKVKHNLDNKNIRESVRTLGLKKTVEVAQQNTEKKETRT